ncbi:MAG: L-threonylcarbamoyladenylate synthase [Bacteroidota bacterium]
MAHIGTDLQEAKRWLDAGEVIGIPTETVYGLAGNAINPEAILRIFKVKNRPSFDPLIIHVFHWDHLKDLVEEFPAPLERLARAFWPGPLTLLLPRKPIIPDLVTSGLPHVAVRMPRHPLTQELLSVLDYPLAAPSANPFGYISPTMASHVDDQLGDQVPYILDGGPSQVGLESTIVGLENGQLTAFRLGGLSLSDLEAAAGQSLQVKPHSSSNPAAPGMLKSHYAPKVPLRLQDPDETLQTYAPGQIGILAFQEKDDRVPEENQRVLSPSGSLDEAARNLFGALRQLDQLPVQIILAQRVPDTGLGKAINDRLLRASVLD